VSIGFVPPHQRLGPPDGRWFARRRAFSQTAAPLDAIRRRSRDAQGPKVRRLFGGGEWIRNFSSAMPCIANSVGAFISVGEWRLLESPKQLIGLPRPTTARVLPPRRPSVGPNPTEASKPLPIRRGTEISNPFPSSGESYKPDHPAIPAISSRSPGRDSDPRQPAAPACWPI